MSIIDWRKRKVIVSIGVLVILLVVIILVRRDPLPKLQEGVRVVTPTSGGAPLITTGDTSAVPLTDFFGVVQEKQVASLVLVEVFPPTTANEQPKEGLRIIVGVDQETEYIFQERVTLQSGRVVYDAVQGAYGKIEKGMYVYIERNKTGKDKTAQKITYSNERPF